MTDLIVYEKSELSHIIILCRKDNKQALALSHIDIMGNLQGVPIIPSNYVKFLKVHNQIRPFLNFFAIFVSKAVDKEQYSFYKIPIHYLVHLYISMSKESTANNLLHYLEKIPQKYLVVQREPLTSKSPTYKVVRLGKSRKVTRTKKAKNKKKATLQTTTSNTLNQSTLNYNKEYFTNWQTIEPMKIQASNQSYNQDKKNNTAKKATSKETANQKSDPVKNTPKQDTQQHKASLDKQDKVKSFIIKESQVNWGLLDELGVSKQRLINSNQLELLLKGLKTKYLYWIKYRTHNLLFKFEARISFRHNQDGLITIVLHGINKEPALHLPFFDHNFTEQDKTNLLHTGNMGRVAILTNKFSQEKIPSLISIDKLTNEIIAIDQEKVKVPEVFKGVNLSLEQQEDLRQGKKIFLQGLQSNKGTIFDAHVQYNADRRFLDFFFTNNPDQTPITFTTLGVPTTFRGITFTEEQIIELESGHWVYLDNLVGKKANTYKGYVLFNEQTKSLDFFFERP